jgi:NADPH:quinone reductase-like Zn-dependent oxidoreductase
VIVIFATSLPFLDEMVALFAVSVVIAYVCYGLRLVQIAKQYGTEVTGVDSATKLDALRAVGFDHVIDYQTDDFTRNGQRYDLILDTKTNRSPWRYLGSLNPGGRYVTVGGRLSRLLQTVVLGPLIARVSGKRVRLVALETNKNLEYVSDLFDTGGLKCVIDGPYPLNNVSKAVQWFGDAKHIGKVVITVASQGPERELTAAS